MTLCWFAEATAPSPLLSTTELDDLAALTATIPGVTEAHLFTPAATNDPYLNDGAPPRLALQLYFDGIASLEAALSPGGALMPLPDRLGPDFTQQAMLARGFAVPDPVPGMTAACTYLVAYHGTAEDVPRWLSHYIDHHAPIMTRFPAVRRVEVCSRIDWCGALPWRRVTAMQRNKVVFDDPAALTLALNSPVRHEMRADFEHFAPFSGEVTHFPMRTRINSHAFAR